jgi:sigma-B regulation protein RsbU (phosphoserine phosphatase)
MYLRNSLLYVSAKEERKFVLAGRRGYKETDGLRQRAALEVFTKEDRARLPADIRETGCEDNLFCKWVTDHQDIVEKEQVEVNPKYESVKRVALDWFKQSDIELVVPLILENRVNGILGLGKKENLQAYTAKDIELLKKLGQEVGVTVFNALHYEDLAEKERLDEEMKMGKQIQMSLLPREIPQIPGLAIDGLMQPAKEIGGDYYDFISLSDKDKLSIVIGDVSGKGVAAGLLMSLVKATMHNLSEEGLSPREVLLRTNRFLHRHIGGQKFMTLLYLLWDNLTKTVTYSSAGHEHILLYRQRTNQVESIMSGGFMLGMIPNIESFLEEKQISLNPGDKILLYTDGVTEAQRQLNDRFGLQRLIQTFHDHSRKPVNDIMQAVRDEVYSFIGSWPQYDDITLVVMEVT